MLIPWLCDQGKRPTVFVGTSAGAINAALFAAVARGDPREGASTALDVWRSLTLQQVFRSPLLSVPLRTVPAYLGQLLGVRGRHVISLLDTSPLRRTAQRLFAGHAEALHEIIHGPDPVVDALAVVATDDRDRTTVFSDLRDGIQLPATEMARAIDYERASVGVDHLLASSAIPALFAPVQVGERWYIDGGVRLNVPLEPAIALGATELAVVATHPSAYPAQAPPGPAGRQPDVVDATVAVLDAVLADRMVEDLHTLEMVNRLVAPDQTRADRRRIPFVFVGPHARHELGELAEEIYRQRFGGLGAVREPDLWLLEHLIGPREHRVGDLLSYLFFDQSFIDAAIALGARHAQAVIDGPDPWSD